MRQDPADRGAQSSGAAMLPSLALQASRLAGFITVPTGHAHMECLLCHRCSAYTVLFDLRNAMNRAIRPRTLTPMRQSDARVRALHQGLRTGLWCEVAQAAHCTTLRGTICTDGGVNGAPWSCAVQWPWPSK